MAEFVEVMKQRSRMCEVLLCYKCPLNKYKNYNNNTCDDFMKDSPQEAEEIIMNWAKEHPVKTNADKFKEVFGVELLNNEGCTGFACPKNKQCADCRYFGFWSKEYKEN